MIRRWAAVVLFWASSLAAAERPNVLLVLLDDLGYSDLGCYGGEIPTPHIDKLAERGVRLTQFYNSARCCPSRASLMTGLHPHQTGIGSFAHRTPVAGRGPAYVGHLNDRCVTMAVVLGAAGYQTYTTNLADMHLELTRELAREWEAWAKRVGAEPYNLPEQ